MALNEMEEDPIRRRRRAFRKDLPITRRSATKQVASGIQVTTSYLINADELQIKMAQGALHLEGGQLRR